MTSTEQKLDSLDPGQGLLVNLKEGVVLGKETNTLDYGIIRHLHYYKVIYKVTVLWSLKP